jgi:hypothetical protein
VKAVDQVPIARFAQDVAIPGQRYRARIGRGRIVEIQDGRVFVGSRSDGARCLTWAQKRIVAIEAIPTPAKPVSILSRKRKSK